MADDLVVGIRLKADGSGFVGEVRLADRELGRLGGRARTVTRDSDRLAESFRRIGHYGVALVGLNVFKNIARDLLQAGTAGQKLQTTFQFVAGTAQGAAQEMAFVRDVAGRLGLDLFSAAGAYAKLAAAAKGTALEGRAARDIFTALSGASTALGLSAEETSGALLAVSQMISKGKVNAEELRGQLGERLPGAFQIAARAMGVSTAQLDAMLQAGEIVSDDFLPRFAAELQRTFAGVLPTATRTAQAEVNRLKTAWDELKVSFAEGGALSAATAGIRGLTDAVREAGPWAKDLAGFLGAAWRILSEGPGSVQLFDDLPARVAELRGYQRELKELRAGSSGRSGIGATLRFRDIMGSLRDAGLDSDADIEREIARLQALVRLSRGVVFGRGTPVLGSLANLPRQGAGRLPIDQIAQETNSGETRDARVKASAAAAEAAARAAEQAHAASLRVIEQNASEVEASLQRLGEAERQRAADRTIAAREFGASLRTESEAIRAEYDARLSQLAQFEQERIDIGMSYAEARTRLEDETAKKILALEGNAMKDMAQTGVEAFKDLQQAVEGWGREAANAIVDFTFTGKTSFGDMVNSILKDLARMAVYQSITRPLFAALSAALPGLLGGAAPVQEGPTLAPLAPLPRRAAGGPVAAGRTYLVGEAGPELLRMGGSGGHVVPNHALGSTISIAVNVDATSGAVDVRGGADQMRSLGAAIAAAVRAEVMVQRRPGGLLAAR